MRFTEHEMTTGVDAVARELFAATRPPWRRGRAEQAYDGLDRGQRYHRLAAAGEIVLPVLVALPERPTVGATPTFSDEEYAEAAAAAIREVHEHRSPGGWEALGTRRRRALVAVAARLTRTAVAAMPPRQDPDALVVPDHL